MEEALRKKRTEHVFNVKLAASLADETKGPNRRVPLLALDLLERALASCAEYSAGA
jgi:hypothetical protein